MNLDLEYLGRSGVIEQAGGAALSFQPNLARPKVAFDQRLRNPLRFREAVSALHEVVVGDFRFHKRDRARHEAWKAAQTQQEQQLRDAITSVEKRKELEKLKGERPPDDLESDFRRMHQLYWHARRTWASELSRNDPELFRALVPCDPVVTVAPDTVFFECFAKDESSYGCLFVDREAFDGAAQVSLGTTNVDYSAALYEHFQTLRTYRETRLLVDPTGFEVKVQHAGALREEKIDLPHSWLKGFGQLSAAFALPCREVDLSIDVVYSLLAWLERHREKTGPRSLEFHLTPGQSAGLTLQPWGTRLESRGRAYEGDKPEVVKVWGRRRLKVLARLLPLAERVTVQLLGSGLPSIWTVHLGEMRFVLALSGWTANDWTSGSNLELLAGAFAPDLRAAGVLHAHLKQHHTATLAQFSQVVQLSRPALVGSLHHLAQQGQVIFDFATRAYRFREVMPQPLSEEALGPPSPELSHGLEAFRTGGVAVERREALPRNRLLLVARVKSPGATREGTRCEAVFDADGAYSKATCGCDHFRSFRLRKGPCRHLVALKLFEGDELTRPGARDGQLLH